MKYLVDFFLNDEIQAVGGYIMMPMFVITIFNSFLMQPTAKSLGDAWNSHNITLLKKMVTRHVLILSVASVFVLFLGLYVGLPLLAWVYRIELLTYKTEFAIIMLGGTLYTLSVSGMPLLIAMRKQKWLLIGCAATIIVYVLSGKVLVDAKGLFGASLVYTAANLVLLSVFVFGMLKKGKEESE